MELLSKHMYEKPLPPTIYNKNITPEFSDLVMKMIAKKPEDRLQNLREFVSRLPRIRIFKDDPDPMADRMAM